ncbi:hypothetical protein DY000_02044304 [Brassica cretica]|uniref:RING-type domain-containing protein n=1 Tax=Brassica cretica TaxID=69181 RepID=A0ABQ7EU82_BRACR|nr:hypothetical protein DY000_02044304 [Brassica cretica]
MALFIEGIDLEDIRTYVQCPICLGIIRKTRTFMECLHRFCQECIDKSMRFGNHECPACRKHVASRRSLRPDPKFDAFIAAIFGNIDSYEEQDLAFDGDELARNMQIQATIAQVSQRQSEALVKTKSSGKDAPRSQPSGSGSRRRRRNSRNMEHDTSQAAHDDDGDNNRVNASSSAEILPRKRNRRSAARSTAQPSSSSCQNVLHVAAECGKTEVVKYILRNENYANLINQKDHTGNTPLHLATVFWYPMIVHILTKDERVNVGEQNKLGFTALDAAEECMDLNPTFRERLTWMALVCVGTPRALKLMPYDSFLAPVPQEGIIQSNEMPSAKKYKDRVNTLLGGKPVVASCVAPCIRRHLLGHACSAGCSFCLPLYFKTIPFQLEIHVKLI